jgi:HD-like signal output (HDOD) protein
MFDHSPLMASIQHDLLGGDVVFPTCFQLSIAIREALNQPDISVASVARRVEAEPLMAAKLVHMANCVTFNPFGRTVYGVEQAIYRVGFNVARSVSIAIAMAQLKMLPCMVPYVGLTNTIWERSVHVAALMRQLAHLEGSATPDEALLCGLVSEMGVFYLLHRCTGIPTYSRSMDHVLDLLSQHSQHVTPPLLAALGVPEEIVTALKPARAPWGTPSRQLQTLLLEARRLQSLPDPIPPTEPRATWLQAVNHQVNELRNSL